MLPSISEAPHRIAHQLRRFEQGLREDKPIGPFTVSFSLFLFVTGSALDVFSTYVVLTTVPLSYEANPLARAFLSQWEYAGLIIHKLATLLTLVVLGVFAFPYRHRYIITVCTIGGIAGFIAASHNMLLALLY